MRKLLKMIRMCSSKKAPISAGQAALCGQFAAPVVGQGCAFKAKPAVVLFAVAQGQAFGQMFCIGNAAQAHEPCFAHHEDFYLGVVPAASVAVVALLGRHQRVAAAERR